MKRANQNGVTLIELMISMVIGLFLLGAMGSVYFASRDTYRTSEMVSRMQDNGRIAMQILTEDLQMAGFLGNSMNPNFVTVPNTLPAATGDCVPGWSTNMSRLLIVGDDATPTFNGVNFGTTCLSTVNYHATTDTIAVKRAANANIPTAQLSSVDHQNWLLLRTDTMRGEFFIGSGGVPSGFTSAVTDRRWLAHVYYITYNAADTVPENRLPILKRLRLGSGPSFFNDRELVRGVQDMQIQFGIDTNGDGNANRFVTPGTEGINRVVAARIWLLMRSEEREVSHDDSMNTYLYANKRYIPGDATTNNETETATNPEQFRRLLLSKTVTFRNQWQ